MSLKVCNRCNNTYQTSRSGGQLSLEPHRSSVIEIEAYLCSECYGIIADAYMRREE